MNLTHIYNAGGGDSGTQYVRVDSISVAANTASYVAKGDLPTPRTQGANIPNHRTNTGYIMGGYGAVYRTDVVAFYKAVDTQGGLTKGSLATGNYLMGGGATETMGFAMGGNPNGGGYVSTTEAMSFAIDTAAAVTKGNLTLARGNAGGGFAL